MENLVTADDFTEAALRNFLDIFTPKQLFYLSVLAQNRKETGRGSVSFDLYTSRNGRVYCRQMEERITTDPEDIPDIIDSLLKSDKD